jgi:hypothetical protein
VTAQILRDRLHRILTNLVGEQEDRPVDANSRPPAPLRSDGFGNIRVAASDGRREHLQWINGEHKVVPGLAAHSLPFDPKWHYNDSARNPTVSPQADVGNKENGTSLQIRTKSSTNCQFQYLTESADTLSWVLHITPD